MLFLLYTANFVIFWSFSRNPFFAALLATVISMLSAAWFPFSTSGSDSQRSLPPLLPSGSDQKVIVFPACTKLKTLV